MATAQPDPSPIEWTWPAKTKPPLELQLLPPSPFAASESAWGIDACRLQQLMMGTCATSPAAGIHTPSTDLGALSDGRGSLQPLPSGWERCLDLQSGKVFLKESDGGASRVLQSRCEEQGKDEKSGSSSRGVEVLQLMNVEQRQDWSLRWLEGDNIQDGSGAAVNKKSSIASFNRDMPTVRLAGEPVCLDLDLRLTSRKRSKPSINIQGQGVPLSTGAANVMGKGQQQGPSTKEKRASDRVNLEVAKECSMVTAVCTKCLMYVLLRRSKAVCPRCSLPIYIEGTATASVSRKRPLLELPSLSTDSGS